MESGQFLELVEQAVNGLPRVFRERLENIAITVEDYPSPAVLKSLDRPAGKRSLLGIYIGIPYNRRPAGPISGKLPDRIELYQRNIEDICRSPQEVVEQVRETIIHEVGHYFGLSDEDLDKLKH